MRKYLYGVGAIIVPVLLGATLTAGCSDENGEGGLLDGAGDVCGPCGLVANGDVGISGDARLDGFFKALGTINNTTVGIRADFEGNIRALAAVYDVELGATIDADAVGELTAAIEADISANVEGGLQVVYQPARCQASVNVAFEAQARCEAQADCDVDVNPGELSVACEGKCTGGCTGECSGELSCEIDPPEVACDGSCEGSCTLEAGGTCNGTCRGECDGECSARDGEGNCAGECTGECTGTCELTVAAECSGRCTGKCLVDPGSTQCSAEASCRGTCDAQCEGSCEGNFTPPSASASCEARAECQASAKAEANASLECTPPQLDVDFVFAGNANLAAQAAFTARLSELKVRGAAIIQGAAKYEALITGTVDGEVVFNPSPVAQLRTSIQGLANANAIANFDIAVGKLPCVVPAFQQAGTIVASIATDTATTLEAQGDFVSAFAAGFDTDS
jgi:modification target Cys-rich repeat protein